MDRKPTILSTNLSPEEVAEMIAAHFGYERK